MKKLFFLCLFTFSFFQHYGQGEIPVDMYTGTPQIEVPVAVVRSHDLSEYVSLVYDAKGVRPSEVNGPVGISWGLQAGGKVYREVRGLPDDFKGLWTDGRRGWLYQRTTVSPSISQEVGNLGNTADLSATTCADELTDYQDILQFGYMYDTQPDIFHYSVGGLTGSFVFDNSATPEIRLIPYRDILIEPNFQSGSFHLVGFKITTNNGVVYELNAGKIATRLTEQLPLETTVEFNKTEFELYAAARHDNYAVNFTSEWKLFRKTSPSGDRINYGYQSRSDYSVHIFKALISNPAGTEYQSYDVYKDSTAYQVYDLLSVTSSTGQRIDIGYEEQLITSITIGSDRAGSDYNTYGALKTFTLAYEEFSGRSLLKTITESGGVESLPPYVFDYYNSYLPPPDTKSLDFWGYYNGMPNGNLAPAVHVYPALPPSERIRLEEITGYAGKHYAIPGANRKVNPGFIQVGTLKTISYPMGGLTTVKYEANTYYDSVANEEYYGGGLRIRSITYTDGLNPDSRIHKTYYYNDDSGKSSGRLAHKPSFTIPTWKYKDPANNNENILIDELGGWTYLLVRTESDIASGSFMANSAVGYTQVTVQRRGAGFVKYRYQFKAAYGTEQHGEWSAVINKFTRNSVCPDLKILANGAGINTFPYAPNPNYDHERGLVRMKLEYDDDSTLVRETSYAYQSLYKTGTTAKKVWGLKWERFPNSEETILLYGKYNFLADVAKVLASETVTLYHATIPQQKMTASSEYFYESQYHKLLTRVRNTAIDSTVEQTYLKYPLDYGTVTSASDEASEMIGSLQSQYRNEMPIEQYRTVQQNGEAEKVVSGSVVKLSDFDTSGKVVPQYQMTWRSGTPKLKSAFTPSYIHPTLKTFITDDDYDIVSTTLGYTEFDKPFAVTDESRVPASILWNVDTGVPVVRVKGATPTQVAFSDFELPTTASFSTACISCDPFYHTLEAGGRTGYWAVSPYETSISKTLTKGGNTYKFSGWYNKKTPTLQIQVTVKNASKTTTYYNNTLTATFSSTSAYEYFEKEIPIDPTLSEFYIEVTLIPSGTLDPNVATALVDDIAFLPVGASLTATTYSFPYGPGSMTTGDKTFRQVYDGLGRVTHTLDKDHNILERNTYQVNEQ